MVNLLLQNKDIEVIAACRSWLEVNAFKKQNIAAVILDYDEDETHLPAFTGIDRLFMVTGYTVDMLRQSKVLIDNAKKAGVKHIVHLGNSGPDDATIPHWGWHQFVERYIEWAGFSYTHLRPEIFMETFLSFGGRPAIYWGAVIMCMGDARVSWVAADDVALAAVEALCHPEKHDRQTYRMGYEALTFPEIAVLLTEIVQKPFRCEPAPPEMFLQAMMDSDIDICWMRAVYEHMKLAGEHKIPGCDDVFDNFPAITGRQPTTWAEFISKNKVRFDELAH